MRREVGRFAPSWPVLALHLGGSHYERLCGLLFSVERCSGVCVICDIRSSSPPPLLVVGFNWSVLCPQSDGVMTELGGVNGHAGTPVGGYPPSSIPQSTPTASLPPTTHHTGPHTAHRPVDLSQAQRDSQAPPTPTIPYPLHDPHTQRPTLLDTGEYGHAPPSASCRGGSPRPVYCR